MKIDLNDKIYKYTILVILISLALYLISMLDFLTEPIFKAMKVVLLPVLFASFFYYIFRPLVRLMQKIKINKTIAIVIIVVLIVGIIFLISFFAGKEINKEFSSFNETFKVQLENLKEFAKDLMNKDEIWIFSTDNLKQNATKALESVFNKITQNITGWISNISDVVTYIILIPITIFFLLKDDKLFYSIIYKKIPEDKKKSMKELFKRMDTVLSSYFTGQIIVAAFLGVITYIGYLIIGIPNALALALFSTIMSIIPFIGPILGVVPAILIGWTVGFSMIIKAIIVVVIAQQIEGNLISPNVMGKRLEIHPLAVIFVVITGLTLFGFLGALFAVPIYGVLREIYRHNLKAEQV